MAAPFTPEQEARLREIVREEIAADAKRDAERRFKEAVAELSANPTPGEVA